MRAGLLHGTDQKMDNIDVLGDINLLIRNYDIGDVLFNYLSIEELNNSRLVCKLWNEKICEILRKSWKYLKIIELCQFEKFNEFQKTMENAGEPRIFSQFYARLDNFINFGEQFFEKYRPKLLTVHLFPGPPPGDFEGVKPTNIDDLLTLLQWSAGSLKELHIKGVSGFGRNIIILPDRNDRSQDLVHFDLPHLKKITIKLESQEAGDKNDLMMYRVFSEIFKKSPNLKSLKLYDVFATKSGNFIKNLRENNFLLKLQEFSVLYDFNSDCDDRVNEEDGTQRVGPMDLFEMQENGLVNLKSFNLQLNFYQYKEDKLGPDFDIISRFIRGQSEQLESLGLNIGIDKGSDISSGFKINLPILPKLWKLHLGNVHGELNNCSNLPFVLMDLSDQFPVLHEIHLSLMFNQDFKFTTWNLMFTGSSQTVQILSLNLIGDWDENVSTPRTNYNYLILENLFPNVKKFEIKSDLKKFFGDKGKKPWENSLEIFSILMTYWYFEQLDFDIFLPFKGLQRIELKNVDVADNIKKAICPVQKFDMTSFEKLQIKSLKIHHFMLSAAVVKKIQGHCIFDYSPEKPEFANSYNPDNED